jgi:hypothetical protein
MFNKILSYFTNTGISFLVALIGLIVLSITGSNIGYWILGIAGVQVLTAGIVGIVNWIKE